MKRLIGALLIAASIGFLMAVIGIWESPHSGDKYAFVVLGTGILFAGLILYPGTSNKE